MYRQGNKRTMSHQAAPWEGERVHPDQSVYEMVEEVLERQAKGVVKRSGCSAREAREAVSRTDAGRQLCELKDGPLAHEKARDWQESLLWKRAFEQWEGMVRLDAASRIATVSTEGRYSWLESYMERLEGKEARLEYYMLVEAAGLASLRG
jgi:hypothetical protein